MQKRKTRGWPASSTLGSCRMSVCASGNHHSEWPKRLMIPLERNGGRSWLPPCTRVTLHDATRVGSGACWTKGSYTWSMDCAFLFLVASTIVVRGHEVDGVPNVSRQRALSLRLMSCLEHSCFLSSFTRPFILSTIKLWCSIVAATAHVVPRARVRIPYKRSVPVRERLWARVCCRPEWHME